jgi:uncharacterized protein with FMN-binding domain
MHVRTAATAAVSALALALPSVNAWAAATTTKTTPKKKVTVAKKSFTGTPGSADRWGDVQVTIVVRKTTTTIGKKKTVKRRIISVRVPEYPNHTDRSIYINQQALPYLVQETLQAQMTGNIQLVGGATDTSYGFGSSLQSALIAARKW